MDSIFRGLVLWILFVHALYFVIGEKMIEQKIAKLEKVIRQEAKRSCQ